MEITFEQLTQENYNAACAIDRDDIPESFVDTASTIMEINDYGLEHNLIGHTFLIRCDGAYAGLILLGEAIPWDTDPPQVKQEPFYRLMGFVIDRKYRSRGIGGLAMEGTIARVYEDFGVRPIVMGCHKENERAAAFYEKHGFIKTDYMEGNDRYYLRYPKKTNREKTGMEMNPDIRITETELTEDVLEELIRLSEDWEKENSCHGYRKNEKSDIEGNRIFLAFSGETVIGYLFGHTEKSKQATSIMPDGTPCFEIEEIYIRPEYRSRGVGRKLFDFAERTVSGEVDYLTLSTATKNWKAILHFYLEELDMDFWSARLFKKIAKAAE